MTTRALLRSLFAAGVIALAACDSDDRAATNDDAPLSERGVGEAIAEGAPGDPSATPSASDPSSSGVAGSSEQPATAASLRASLDRLVSGMGGDTATWFSEHTADILRSVEVDGRGHAIVDFHDLRQVIPNASSSAGSALLLHQVNTAVFATPGVASVEYRMSGSCELLGEWLQYGVCLRFDRDAIE